MNRALLVKVVRLAQIGMGSAFIAVLMQDAVRPQQSLHLGHGFAVLALMLALQFCKAYLLGCPIQTRGGALWHEKDGKLRYRISYAWIISFFVIVACIFGTAKPPGA